MHPLIALVSNHAKRRGAAVSALLFQTVSRYSSSFYETARNLLRSRSNQFAKVRRLQKQLGEAHAEAGRLKNKWQRASDELHEARRQLKQQHDRADDDVEVLTSRLLGARFESGVVERALRY